MKRALVLVVALAACGSPPPRAKVTVREVVTPPPKPSTIAVIKEEPEPDAFQATAGTGDAVVPYVRDERSSRLDVPAPTTRGKEAWRLPLAEESMRPAFMLTTGNRAAVIGADAWVVFDTKGMRIAGHEADAPNLRLDRASGAVVPDELRGADVAADGKLAARNGLAVIVKGGGVYIGERAIEGKFEALDVAIDDAGVAIVPVKQGDDVSLWTIPISGNTAIGRHKIGKRRVIGPPVLGKTLRVLVLDTGLAAYDLTGKKRWEKKGGAPSGGVTMTSDDHLLVADDGKVISYDPKGRALELWSSPDVTFVTPPVLTADGLMLVASAGFLHAFTF